MRVSVETPMKVMWMLRLLGAYAVLLVAATSCGASDDSGPPAPLVDADVVPVDAPDPCIPYQWVLNEGWYCVTSYGAPPWQGYFMLYPIGSQCWVANLRRSDGEGMFTAYAGVDGNGVLTIEQTPKRVHWLSNTNQPDVWVECN